MFEIIHNIIFITCHVLLVVIGIVGLTIMSILIGNDLNKRKF